MDRTADLDAALRFAIGRITEQANLSGELLSDEENLLLNYLPAPTLPRALDPEVPTLVPRNIPYERICALGKAAYLNDRRANPASPDWEFAFAVFTLNRHLMWGVLQQAGLKYRRPLWDQLFVIGAALIPVIGVMLLAWNKPQRPFRLAANLFGCVAGMLFIYFASQRIEQWQLVNRIERCRLACRNINWKAS